MSPTVLNVRGFAVRIYLQPREHGPAHVHVIKDDGEVVIVLGKSLAELQIREVRNMKEADARQARRIVSEHYEALMAAWRKYHGEK